MTHESHDSDRLNQVYLNCSWFTVPIPSMYGIFTYIWVIFMVNVGKYTIHGSTGVWMILLLFDVLLIWWWSRRGWPWFVEYLGSLPPKYCCCGHPLRFKNKNIFETHHPLFFWRVVICIRHSFLNSWIQNYHQPSTCVLFDGIISMGKIVIPSGSWLTETENGFMESNYLCIAFFRW